MAEIWRAIKRTATYREIVEDREMDEERKVYLTSRDETWGRAYGQYIAWRSGDREIIAQVNAAVAAENLRQWGHNEFLPVAEAFDRLFFALGWMR